MRLAVVGEREPLNLLVELAPQVVAHPLADAGGEVLLPIRADGADNSDDGDGGHRKIQPC